MQYLDLADLMVIASAALDVDVDELVHQTDLHVADCALNAPRAGYGEVELYPDFAVKAALLGWHIIRYDPLPIGSTGAGYLCMTEFVERNGRRWLSVPGEPGRDQTVGMLGTVAEGSADFGDFVEWVRGRIVS